MTTETLASLSIAALAEKIKNNQISFYEILDVTPRATEGEIIVAHQHKSPQYHPDLTQDAEEKIQREVIIKYLNNAKLTLLNPAPRALYDEMLALRKQSEITSSNMYQTLKELVDELLSTHGDLIKKLKYINNLENLWNCLEMGACWDRFSNNQRAQEITAAKGFSDSLSEDAITFVRMLDKDIQLYSQKTSSGFIFLRDILDKNPAYLPEIINYSNNEIEQLQSAELLHDRERRVGAPTVTDPLADGTQQVLTNKCFFKLWNSKNKKFDFDFTNRDAINLSWMIISASVDFEGISFLLIEKSAETESKNARVGYLFDLFELTKCSNVLRPKATGFFIKKGEVIHTPQYIEALYAIEGVTLDILANAALGELTSESVDKAYQILAEHKDKSPDSEYPNSLSNPNLKRHQEYVQKHSIGERRGHQ